MEFNIITPCSEKQRQFHKNHIVISRNKKNAVMFHPPQLGKKLPKSQSSKFVIWLRY